MAKPALGRGLGALLGGSSLQGKTPLEVPRTEAAPASIPQPAPMETGPRVQSVGIDRIHPCSFQPRKHFPSESLQELADSIREQGVVQPLIVRERLGRFEIIAGERRWRASQLVGLKELPIIVREADDRTVLELALIENLQRENLNPIEEALGYAQLIGQFNLKQEEAAQKVGKSRAVVANALRLLRLPQKLQDSIRDGGLSVGHAKVILGLDSEALQNSAADQILAQGLNVRQTEELVARLNQPIPAPATSGTTPSASPRDANRADIESRLRERFGTKIRIKYNKGKGSIDIAFFSDDELERLLNLLGIDID